jgi:hypothetical protein
MASNIRVVVDEAKRGLIIRWFEDGLERHVWVDHGRFEDRSRGLRACAARAHSPRPRLSTCHPKNRHREPGGHQAASDWVGSAVTMALDS